MGKPLITMQDEDGFVWVSQGDWDIINCAKKEAQAKIDALMLEYCPDEMTPEQLKTWGENQESE